MEKPCAGKLLQILRERNTVTHDVVEDVLGVDGPLFLVITESQRQQRAVVKCQFFMELVNQLDATAKGEGRGTASWSDDATEHDQLGRSSFALSLASIIRNAPENTSFRIGVYGAWGGGKTSVMKMMQKALASETCDCLSFVPWPAQNADALRAKLFRAIAEELGLLDADRSFFKRAKALLKNEDIESIDSLLSLWETGKEVDSKVKAFDGAVKYGMGVWRQRTEKKLLSVIKIALLHKKLVVFVDDLDRVRPELLPDLLLYLREVVNVPNLHYVLGISPEVVEQGLADLHKGWGNAGNFLEKIVEYPAYLPEPSEAQLRKFIKNEIKAMGDAVDIEALEKLLPYLPRNPRRLKQFLRYLHSMREEADRYSYEEINRAHLYMAQMFRLEFPHETRELCKASDVLRAIEAFLHKQQMDKWMGRYNLPGQKGEQEKTKQAVPGEEYAPPVERKKDRERYLFLCGHLDRSSFSRGKYSLLELLTLFDHPPLVTHKEARRVLDDFSLVLTVDERRKVLIQGMKRRKLSEEDTVLDDLAESLSALVKRVGQLRKELEYELIGAELQEEQEPLLKPVLMAFELLQFLFSEMCVVSSGFFTMDDWKDLIEEYFEFAHFEHTPFGVVRSEEEKVFVLIAQEMSTKYPNEIYYHLLRCLSASSFGPEHAVKARSRIEKAAKVVEKNVVEAFSHLFSVEDGVVDNLYEGFREVAINPQSLFHTPENRKRFYSILGKAKENTLVQLNALNYFSRVAYWALKPSSFDEGSYCQKLLTDQDFVRHLWSASVAKPLERRNTGSLREKKCDIVNNLKVPTDWMPEPEWYKYLAAQYPMAN